jgi:hypothetical protein
MKITGVGTVASAKTLSGHKLAFRLALVNFFGLGVFHLLIRINQFCDYNQGRRSLAKKCLRLRPGEPGGTRGFPRGLGQGNRKRGRGQWHKRPRLWNHLALFPKSHYHIREVFYDSAL